MRSTLTDYLGSVLDAPISRLRRQTISIALCVAAAIGAIFYAAAAATLALEAQVGPVYAHLITAGAFILLAIGAILVPRLLSRSEAITHRAQAEAKAMPRNDRMAMIIEAVLMGFNAAAGKKTAKAGKH
jgi:cytochrome c biogenesis protein CcdA